MDSESQIWLQDIYNYIAANDPQAAARTVSTGAHHEATSGQGFASKVAHVILTGLQPGDNVDNDLRTVLTVCAVKPLKRFPISAGWQTPGSSPV